METEGTERLEELPIFPLATVLFPGAILPLHIFEERYKQMMRHARVVRARAAEEGPAVDDADPDAEGAGLVGDDIPDAGRVTPERAAAPIENSITSDQLSLID